MDKLGFDPNDRAAVNLASIEKILALPKIKEMLKGTGITKAKDVIIEMTTNLSWYGFTYPDGKVKVNSYTAFTTWARLAMTILHEGVHKKDLLTKIWDAKTNLSTWKSEVKAWQLSVDLGDPIGVRFRDKYQGYIDEYYKNQKKSKNQK